MNMDDQLQQLIHLQREQNELLKKHLWRFRFSLLTLLLITTATAMGLGFLVYRQQSPANPPATTIPLFSRSPTSQGTLTINTFETIPPPIEPVRPGYDLIKTD
jgi:hypothetical protein